MRLSLLSCFVGLILFPAMVFAEEPKPLKVGIIGLDTSHVTAFTGLLNSPKAKAELANVKVVAAFPAGSPDVEASATRVKGFTDTLRDKFGVEIVDSIEALLPKVDVILIESVDGRPHLKQFEACLKSGKPVFIDKPVAGSLADAIQIYDLAAQHKVPVFSSSSLRYSADVQGMKKNEKLGSLLGCLTYGPCSLESHHPDLFWYGVHGVEVLYTLMGVGCETVSRTQTKDTDVVTGTWKEGRVATFRGIRGGKSDYGMVVFGSKAIESQTIKVGYEPLLIEIVKFFRGGEAPVSAAETVEMFAFMEAADESKRQGGAPVKIADVIAKARKEIGAKGQK
ncbi:MAG: Gfo/Idh/MocA family oxidoreductase [Planctomycetes bacterium]|nr:Gfo/Idh/MocA family oxidoreductase [Planctomycetota bacterium]